MATPSCGASRCTSGTALAVSVGSKDAIPCRPPTPWALRPAAACQTGPQAVALAAVLNRQFGLSFGKVAALFRERFSLHVTPGGLVRALPRAARRGNPATRRCAPPSAAVRG